MIENSDAQPECTNKMCSDCGVQYPVDNFPKKGNGRYESRCKECFSRYRKNRRHRTKAVKWGLADLPVTIHVVDSTDKDWLTCLFQIIVAQKLMPIEDEKQNVDELLKRESNIERLIA